MGNQINSKIIGATAIGLGLILGAFTVNSLSAPKPDLQSSAAIQAIKTPPRVSIAVTDENNNGIEDWRDEFITTKPIIRDDTPSEIYTPPDTLTGKTGIDIFTRLIQSKMSGAFGETSEELVADTFDDLAIQTEQKIYSVADIEILEVWDDEDIYNYANTLGATVARHQNKSVGQEVEALNDLVLNDNPESVKTLLAAAAAYENYRDDTLNIPVPKVLAKEHTDLLNTIEAVYTDTTAMSKSLEDPLLAIMRIKRYVGDLEGMQLALENMHAALLPYEKLFSANDPALIFIQFSSNYQL